MTLSSNIWGPDKNEMAASPVNVISSMVSLSLFFMGTSAIVVMRRWLISNRRLAELESATLESELKFLKKQINPHFLFNMLNNAYMLVNKQSLDAGNVLLRLEDMLKYQIEDSSKDSVRLEDDIKFIRDFLDLENIRRDKFKFDIQIDGTVEKIDIPPLIFIPFVENAVKHNADSDTISYVDIRFSARDGKLCFICENSKPDIPSEEVKVGGLGLKNIRRRLELLFPNRHDLKVMDTENTYTVILNLDL
ncbi:MAG: histidine kinase [Rikenellaceae bacterium]|nr:histidine kinase [Rikenellaceae bacterium]